jgi:hypothetical protein
MPKKTKLLIISISALVTFGIVTCWRLGRSDKAGDTPLVNWGVGDLRKSEEAYYGGRVFGILDAWRDMGRRADRSPDGQPTGPEDIHLVIDPARPAVWLEDRGQVLEKHRTELPEQLTWTALHDDGSGAKPLDGIVRLKYRGPDRKSQRPEMVWLVGQRRDEYVAFHFNGQEQGRSHIKGSRFKPYHSAPARKQDVGYYDSIVVSEAQYRASQSRWATQGPRTAPGDEQPQRPADEQMDAWSRVERRLYQAIEGQVNVAGWGLVQLQVNPGPDYSAAHADLVVVSRRFLKRFGDQSCPPVHLKIDHLGDGIWYVRSATDPRRPLAGEPVPVHLEFLVRAGEPIDPAARSWWLDKGRKIPTGLVPDGPWKTTLASGAIVEFIGICEDPSGGGPWWGPDGSGVRCPPCFNREAPSHSVGDRRILRLVWRVQRPKGPSIASNYDFADGFGSHSYNPRDRHGVEHTNVYCHDWVFEKGLKQTTLTLGADDDEPRVMVKNLSLVPGQDSGFEIEVVD